MERGSLPVDDPDYPLYSVTQVAEMLGVTPAVLRRWEREGLVRPRRTSGKQRRYSRREIDHLQRIAQLRDEGLATGGIRRVLELEQRIGDLEDQLSEERARRQAAEGRSSGGDPSA